MTTRPKPFKDANKPACDLILAALSVQRRSERWLGRQIRESESMLSHLKSGQRRITMRMALEIASALELTGVAQAELISAVFSVYAAPAACFDAQARMLHEFHADLGALVSTAVAAFKA